MGRVIYAGRVGCWGGKGVQVLNLLCHCFSGCGNAFLGNVGESFVFIDADSGEVKICTNRIVVVGGGDVELANGVGNGV